MLSSKLITKLTSRINLPEDRPRKNIIAPWTGQTLTTVPMAKPEDIAEAFRRAKTAQGRWAAIHPRKRARVLRRFASLVYKHRDEFLDVIQAETGKARSHALEEVLDVILVARYYAKHGSKWLAGFPIAGMMPAVTKARVTREPVGVVGIIAPWNYPLTLAASDGIAALMAGNGIVLKPDAQTPLSALLAVRYLEKAGLPADLWQVTTGAGREVGPAIVEHCDYLMFTGSSATGQRLGGQIGQRLVGYSAELGGKNAMIVDEKCDIDKVLEIAVRACYSNAGQLCISIERIIAVGKSYDKLRKALPQRIARMKLGAGKSWGIEMGSLSGASQLETVRNHVDDAVAQGATVLAGGKPRPDLGPYFFEPTLLADLPEGAICRREETFGPVVTLYKAKTLDEAIAQCNDTDYGLNTAIMSKDSRRAQYAAELVHSGMVNINEGYGPAWSSLDGPSGGWGISGIGARHGQIGLLKYTKVKTIAEQSSKLNLSRPRCIPALFWNKILMRSVRSMKYLPRR